LRLQQLERRRGEEVGAEQPRELLGQRQLTTPMAARHQLWWSAGPPSPIGGNVLLVVVGLFGLAVGSFLNVVVHRLPRGESLLRPGSHCPHCRVKVRPWHNIPVLSWLLLRGRCAGCRGRISARYPLVELGTGLLFVAIAARFGLSPALPAYLYLASVGVA